MKTAISIPDPLFEKGEELAASEGKSRSQLYRDALAEYLVAHDRSEITAAMNKVADQVQEPDPWSSAAARHILENTEW